LQFLSDFDRLFKFLFRDIARRVVACRIPFLREDFQLLNQFWIALECKIQGFDNFLMMSGLYSGTGTLKSTSLPSATACTDFLDWSQGGAPLMEHYSWFAQTD
jgi:hypothetical protein